MPDITVSNKDSELSSELTVYPNPTTDIVHINLNGQLLELIYIYDINGRFLNTVSTSSFSMNKYSNGMYFLVIQTGEGTIFKKIVKN